MLDLSTVSLREVLLGISTLVSLWLIRVVWKSRDPLVLKIALTVVGLIPLFGPLLLLWTANFPEPLPMALRDQYRGPDVHDRWYRVLAAKNPIRRFVRWRAVMRTDVKKNDRLW